MSTTELTSSEIAPFLKHRYFCAVAVTAHLDSARCTCGLLEMWQRLREEFDPPTHEVINRHHCKCGWEGDEVAVHMRDVLHAQAGHEGRGE